MSALVYQVVEHDGGWAYKVGDVFSESFPTHEAAVTAAEQAAQRQQHEVEPAPITYEDAEGHWHTEIADNDQPVPEVSDDADGASADSEGDRSTTEQRTGQI